MLPVYFSRHQEAEMTTNEDYDNAASMNENNLNQNTRELYNKLVELIERVNNLS
jgi:hypothetical protein